MHCADCGVDKAESEFPRDRSSASGHGSYCKPCHNLRTRESVRSNGGARRYHLRGRYGLEPEDVARLIEGQEGKCAICGGTPATQVDHDHRTGAVRGILCLDCNAGLGAFGDDVRLLFEAVDYLHPVPYQEWIR